MHELAPYQGADLRPLHCWYTEAATVIAYVADSPSSSVIRAWLEVAEPLSSWGAGHCRWAGSDPGLLVPAIIQHDPSLLAPLIPELAGSKPMTSEAWWGLATSQIFLGPVVIATRPVLLRITAGPGTEKGERRIYLDETVPLPGRSYRKHWIGHALDSHGAWQLWQLALDDPLSVRSLMHMMHNGEEEIYVS